MIIETERLYLREFIPADSINLYKMNSDKDVLKYTADVPFPSLKEASHFIKNYDGYKKHGIGRWAVLKKEDDTFLGWCGLKYHPEERITDVGYRFYKKYWGQGYATEAAEAALVYGFSVVKLSKIYAHVHPKNSASKKVLEKCGLHFLKVITQKGVPVHFYVKNSPYITSKEITAKQTYPIRHLTLRKGKPLSSCTFEGDDLPATLHLGAFFNDDLIGVVTLLENNNSLFGNANQIQLRGMAVLEAFQKKGIGELLLKKAEYEVVKKNRNFIWMNARAVALPFYIKMGYKLFGNPFMISDIGNHYVMIKTIGTGAEEIL